MINFLNTILMYTIYVAISLVVIGVCLILIFIMVSAIKELVIEIFKTLTGRGK